jgi:hypothetical protein
MREQEAGPDGVTPAKGAHGSRIERELNGPCDTLRYWVWPFFRIESWELELAAQQHGNVIALAH